MIKFGHSEQLNALLLIKMCSVLGVLQKRTLPKCKFANSQPLQGELYHGTSLVFIANFLVIQIFMCAPIIVLIV